LGLVSDNSHVNRVYARNLTANARLFLDATGDWPEGMPVKVVNEHGYRVKVRDFKFRRFTRFSARIPPNHPAVDRVV